MKGPLSIAPEQASTLAAEVDNLSLYLFAVSMIIAGVVFLLIFIFVIKYRRRSPDDPPPPEVHTSKMLEITWTIVPLGIVTSMFLWGASLYYSQRHPPRNAMEVWVTGRQWMWKIQHANGRREINELHVPLGRPIKLIMASEDVIHNFSVPAFRLKMDVLPNRFTQTWFQPTRVGAHQLFCNQYCGTDHSKMTGTVFVMKQDDFEAWLSGKLETGASSSPVEAGALLFSKLGCNTCHQEGNATRAPLIATLFQSTVKLESGGTVVADENYIRESILEPQAKIVQGYQAIMPSFKALVSAEQLNSLVAYIRSLASPNVAQGTQATPVTRDQATSTPAQPTSALAPPAAEGVSTK